MDAIKKAAEELQEIWAKNLLHIYAAAKTVRDCGTEEINRGVSNPVKRQHLKEAWHSLKECCCAV